MSHQNGEIADFEDQNPVTAVTPTSCVPLSEDAIVALQDLAFAAAASIGTVLFSTGAVSGATGTVPPAVATVEDNVVDKGGAAAAAAHGSTAGAHGSTAAAAGVPVRGAAAAAGVSEADSEPEVCRRSWTRSSTASQRPVAGLVAHSGNAGVALMIEDDVEPSKAAEVGPSAVGARPVAAEAPARPPTRASAAAVAAAGLPTRRATRASRAANGARSGGCAAAATL